MKIKFKGSSFPRYRIIEVPERHPKNVRNISFLDTENVFQISTSFHVFGIVQMVSKLY